MMPGSKGQKAVHACMIRLLNLGPAKHEEVVICVANQRIPNVCRIAGAACCGAIRNEIFRGHQLGAKDLLTPTSIPADNSGITEKLFAGRNGLQSKIKNKSRKRKGSIRNGIIWDKAYLRRNTGPCGRR